MICCSLNILLHVVYLCCLLCCFRLPSLYLGFVDECILMALMWKESVPFKKITPIDLIFYGKLLGNVTRFVFLLFSSSVRLQGSGLLVWLRVTFKNCL